MLWGDYYWVRGQYSKALEYLTSAKENFEQGDVNYPVQLAKCPRWLGRTMASQGDYRKGIEMLDQAISINEKFGPDFDITQTLVMKSCLLLKTTNDFCDASLYRFIEASAKKARDRASPITFADTLECLAELYAGRKDWETAIAYYCEAELGYGRGQDVHNAAARCRRHQAQHAKLRDDPVLDEKTVRTEGKIYESLV